MFASSFLLLVALCQLAVAKVAYYDWSIDWVSAAPDGFTRPVIGINGQWPPPEVHIDKGDRVIARVYNNLGNQSTGIHWHGIYQRGSQTMDGPSGISQCPIAPNGTFTYDFEVSLFNFPKSKIANNGKGQPSWHILVSFAQSGPVSGRTTCAFYCPRCYGTFRGQVR